MSHSEPLGLNTIMNMHSLNDVRGGIMKLESALKVMKQGEYPVTHHYSENSYAREIFIPKNSIVVGKIHRHGHINVISLGDVTVVTEFGIKRMKAPLTFASQPGTKRALITHEDTIWTTIHVTEKTNLQEIEDEIICESFEAYDEIAFQKNLELATRVIDAESRSE